MGSNSEESVGSNTEDLKEFTFSKHIYQVLKEVHHDLGITREAMEIMDDLINRILERLSVEASRLVEREKQPFVTAREMQTAIRILLSGELGKNAVEEGTKAVLRFSCS